MVFVCVCVSIYCLDMESNKLSLSPGIMNKDNNHKANKQTEQTDKQRIEESEKKATTILREEHETVMACTLGKTCSTVVETIFCVLWYVPSIGMCAFVYYFYY